MHMTIGVIVFAVDKDDAESQAETIFERLTGDSGQPFDYYSSKANNPGGLKDIPGPMLVTTRAGKAFIKANMAATIRNFNYHLGKIRKGIPNHTDDEIMCEAANDQKDQTLAMIRYSMYQCGSYSGPGIWLYDNDGSGIRDTKHLANVLTKWKEVFNAKTSQPYKGLDVYVVPADVHY
jgi:hypothetical protein